MPGSSHPLPNRPRARTAPNTPVPLASQPRSAEPSARTPPRHREHRRGVPARPYPAPYIHLERQRSAFITNDAQHLASSACPASCSGGRTATAPQTCPAHRPELTADTQPYPSRKRSQIPRRTVLTGCISLACPHHNRQSDRSRAAATRRVDPRRGSARLCPSLRS